MQPVLDLLDARLSTAVPMTEAEFDWLLDFVRNGLLDPSARPQYLQRLIPEKLPSGRAGLTFQ
jgi:hypothetical protein